MTRAFTMPPASPARASSALKASEASATSAAPSSETSRTSAPFAYTSADFRLELDRVARARRRYAIAFIVAALVLVALLIRFVLL